MSVRVTPHSSLPVTMNLLPVFTELPVLDISSKWNHTACGLQCLVCFTQQHVLKIHPFFMSPYGWIIFPYMDGPHCIYRSSVLRSPFKIWPHTIQRVQPNDSHLEVNYPIFKDSSVSSFSLMCLLIRKKVHTSYLHLYLNNLSSATGRTFHPPIRLSQCHPIPPKRKSLFSFLSP